MLSFLLGLVPPESISVIPRPQEVMMIGGAIQFGSKWRIDAPTDTIAAVGMLRDHLKREYKTELATQVGDKGRIRFVYSDDATLGSEGYGLEVNPSEIVISARGASGYFYATQTLEQLIQRIPGSSDLTIPMLKIRDYPRFPWRGMMLDVSRHFYPKRDILKFLDHLAMNKMNVFHWHLVDDGGWRIEIKKYPKLTQVGGFRNGERDGWLQSNLKFDIAKGKKYGGFYTQKEIREVVDYAARRGITVVPEIEMPGHSMAACASYPELACDGLDAIWEKQTGMKHPNVYCPAKESTFQFVQDVLDETMELFPSKYIHVGGDEVDKFLWQNCKACQKVMSEKGIKNANEYQSYFMHRVDSYLTSKGRNMIGWDEILEGGLAPGTRVMSWRGLGGGIAAAKSGHDVVMSPTSHCYFDYPYTTIPTEKAYGYEPIPAALSESEAKHVLGAQGNVWTEWINDFSRVETMAMPRMQAMAEATWTNPDRKSWPDFSRRLGAAYGRLDAMGASFYLPPPTATYDALIFSDQAIVSFESSSLTGAQIRYTTDGREPTQASPEYRGPFAVNRTMTVRAATFARKGRSDSATVGCVKFAPTALPELTRGIRFVAVQGAFRKMPDFSKQRPVRTGFVEYPIFNLGQLIGLEENFGIQYDGYIQIPTDGTYQFSLSSDDGSILRIARATVVDNDGLHGAVDKVGRVSLKAGLYPVEIQYFQAGGALSLNLSVTGPGISKRPIPKEWLLANAGKPGTHEAKTK